MPVCCDAVRRYHVPRLVEPLLFSRHGPSQPSSVEEHLPRKEAAGGAGELRLSDPLSGWPSTSHPAFRVLISLSAKCGHRHLLLNVIVCS